MSLLIQFPVASSYSPLGWLYWSGKKRSIQVPLFFICLPRWERSWWKAHEDTAPKTARWPKREPEEFLLSYISFFSAEKSAIALLQYCRLVQLWFNQFQTLQSRLINFLGVFNTRFTQRRFDLSVFPRPPGFRRSIKVILKQNGRKFIPASQFPYKKN